MKSKVLIRMAAALMIIFTTPIFVGCNDKDTKKKIILSKDVLKEDKENDKVASQLIIVNDTSRRLVKLKEFNDISFEYFPICWKDDDNVILLKVASPYADEFSIYNLNVDSGKISINGTIKNANVLTELIISPIRKYEPVTSLLFVKDFKLWIYDLLNNTTKEVYDLMGVKADLEKLRANEKELQKINKSSDFYMARRLRNLDINFVEGSNNHIYIKLISPDSVVKSLRILDSNTGSIVESPPEIMEKVYPSSEILYSRVSNKFYLFPRRPRDKDEIHLNEGFYEFKPGEIGSLKKVEKAPPVDMYPMVSEDGRYIYFSSQNYNEKTRKYINSSILKYNIEYGDFSTVFNSNSKDNIMFFKYNYKNNMFLFSDSSDVLTTNENNFNLAFAEDNRIKIISKPEDFVNDDFGDEAPVFNEKGDKFIYRSYPRLYSRWELGKLKLVIYEIENLNKD